MKKEEVPTVELITKSCKKKKLTKKEQTSLLTVNEICSIFLSRQFIKKQKDPVFCSK